MKKNNIKISKKAIALITSFVLGITGYVIAKKCDDNEITMNNENIINNNNLDITSSLKVDTSNIQEVETVQEVIIPNNNFNKGDSVKTTTRINMRFGTSADTFRIGSIPKKETVDRIISLNGFDLIKYDDKLAFISGEYTNSNVADENNEYYYVLEENDIVRTTTEVNFRLGPSTKERKICTIKKNDELTVIGKSISYNDSEDIWYLAKYKGNIGFIKASFTISLKDIIKEIDPSITNVEIRCVGSLINDAPIYDYSFNKIAKGTQFEIVKIIDEKDDYYLVEYNHKFGLIQKDNVEKYHGYFVVVDLSDQRISLYCDTEVVYESLCTTGWNKRRTDVGSFTAYEKSGHRTFSKEHQAKKLWLNFDNGNGIHDADWEEPEYFGSEKYRKHNGSNGCVRVPNETAEAIKKYVDVGTKVLIKK